MYCKKCGKALPSDGIVCKNCGLVMSPEQINYQRRMKNKDDKRITLLTEKFGHKTNIEYRKTKENKLLGLVIITFILLFLIILAILINI